VGPQVLQKALGLRVDVLLESCRDIADRLEGPSGPGRGPGALLLTAAHEHLAGTRDTLHHLAGTRQEGLRELDGHGLAGVLPEVFAGLRQGAAYRPGHVPGRQPPLGRRPLGLGLWRRDGKLIEQLGGLRLLLGGLLGHRLEELARLRLDLRDCEVPAHAGQLVKYLGGCLGHLFFGAEPLGLSVSPPTGLPAIALMVSKTF
jgi:hypothetical protein